MKGKVIKGDMDYLNEVSSIIGEPINEFDSNNVEHLIRALKVNAIYHIVKTGEKLGLSDGLSFDEKWNKKY